LPSISPRYSNGLIFLQSSDLVLELLNGRHWCNPFLSVVIRVTAVVVLLLLLLTLLFLFIAASKPFSWAASMSMSCEKRPVCPKTHLRAMPFHP
jgi:hypothetical protein